MKTFTSFVIAATLMSCTNQDADVELISVGDNDLGITHVSIEESTVNGDPLVTIRGLDADGNEIGLATVRTGLVMATPEPSIMPAEESFGTEVRLAVGAETLPIINGSLAPSALPELPFPKLASFVSLPPVADALANHVQLRFLPRATEELPYDQACSSSKFPSSKGGSTQCCQSDYSPGWTYHRIDTSPYNLATRGFGTPCTDSSGYTGCAGTDCYYGPAGAHAYNAGGSNTQIFKVSYNQSLCGYDKTDGWAYEQYTNQAPWGAVGATSPYTNCSALSVSVVEQTALGTVSTTPSSSISGYGGTHTFSSPSTVGVNAFPAYEHARAVFSGSCSYTGSYGENAWCNTSLSGNTASVTVTFQCEPGWNCFL